MSSENTLKKSAFSGFIWKFAERVLAQMVSLVVSIILARILLPDDYSVVGIVTIFFAFCNVFITGGLNTALIQKKDADEIDYATILHVNMLIALVLYVVMFFGAPLIAGIYDKPLLIPVIRVMGITFFVNGFLAVLSAYTSSTLQFKKFFFSTIVGTVISAVVGITMALNGFGAWALVAQQMTNSIINTIILFITTRFKILFVLSIDRLKGLFRYGWKIFVASFVSVLYDEINPLIVGIKFSATDLSYYTKGKSFPSLLNQTISGTLSSVLFPVMSKIQEDKEEVLKVTRRYIRVASYIIFPMMIGFFAVAKNFVVVILTEKWLFAVPYIQVFCVTYMFNIIQTGNLEAIKAIGRSDITLILEIIKKSAYFIIIALFVFFTNSPEMLAVSSVVCTLIASVVNTYPNRTLIGYRYRQQITDILPNLILAILMGVVVAAMNDIPISLYLLFPLQMLAGAFVYVLLSLLTRNENLNYLLSSIKLLLKRG